MPTGWSYPAVGAWRLVEDAIRDVPEGLAVVGDHHALTWVQFGAVVDDVARGLASRRPDRVVVDCAGGLAALVVAVATWRLGVLLEVRDPTASTRHHDRGDDAEEAPSPDAGADAPDAAEGASVPADSIRANGDRAAAGDVDAVVLVVVDRRRAHPDVPGAEVVHADVERLVRRRADRSAVSRGLRRLGRRLRRTRHDRVPLTSLVDDAGQVPFRAADPDAPALRLPGGTTPTATQRQLVSATFQVRLWIPDVATGSEVVATSIGWWRPAGLVTGFLLAALTAGTCRVADADDLVSTIPGSTLAFAEPATWRGLASGGGWRGIVRRRRGEATGRELRLAGVVVRPGTEVLDESATSALVAATEGARVRHFWQPDEVVGPVLAQPVYGRLAGDPGALPLVDTVLAVHAGTAWASGPQVPPATAGGWAALAGDLPLEVVTGAVARPASPDHPHVGTTWQPGPDPTAPTQESR